MELDINKYLTEQQMEEIARKIFTEKLEKSIEDMINRKEQWGRGVFNDVYGKLVEKYAQKINQQYEAKIEKAIQEEINRTKSYDPDYSDTFYETIHKELHEYAKKIIADKNEELSPIVYDKILSACDDLLFSRIISDLMYKLNLDGTIKDVINEVRKNKND